jgi:hypothetical protein
MFTGSVGLALQMVSANLQLPIKASAITEMPNTPAGVPGAFSLEWTDLCINQGTRRVCQIMKHPNVIPVASMAVLKSFQFPLMKATKKHPRTEVNNSHLHVL